MWTNRRTFLQHGVVLIGSAGNLGFAGAEVFSDVKTITTAEVNIAYEEFGPASGSPTILLHGFPYDVRCYDEVVPWLIRSQRRVLVPYLRGFGRTQFLRADTPRVGQQAALGLDLLGFMDALHLPKAHLAGFDWGGRAACVVASLHPQRVASLVSGGVGYNIQKTDTASLPVAPEKERHHWYWFYLSTKRGETALKGDGEALCRYLWQVFSPTWNFSDEAFARTSHSFQNPDFAAVVLHSYRYRIGAAQGATNLDSIEDALSKSPAIHVPTIILEGADDGVDPPSLLGKTADHFTQLRRQTVLRNVGHNIPQESPELFARAVLEAAS